jgi:hypothetical protein
LQTDEEMKQRAVNPENIKNESILLGMTYHRIPLKE